MLRFHRLIPKPVLASVAVVIALTRFLTGLFGILFIAWGVYAGGVPALFFGWSLIPLALTTNPRKPRLTRATLVVLSISGAIPSMIIGTLQSHWDVVVPRCAYSVFLGVNLPSPGGIVPNIALIQFWKDMHSNALYLSSKYGAPILSEDYELYFVTFYATNLESFLRAARCEPVVSNAWPDVVAYPLYQGEDRLYSLLLGRAFRVT
jgi:hypothetical protein